MRNRLARRRQLAGLKQGDGVPVKEIFPERETRQTRDKVAEAVGFGSGRSYERAVKDYYLPEEKRVCTRCEGGECNA